ncbi:PucR family transcriptional regulator [Streptomyces sp. TR06-5]|uniref:PucR family transcriptional regulator n=1 Tax=unclassified Streptomyces TaxID=2593676 RepID=UPI0039A00D13
MNDPPPPTPSVPLGALLADRSLGLGQVAGPRSTGIRVHAVHTSEMADPVPYLLGGELLLTAGVHATATAGGGRDAEAHWDGYVARTVQAGAAALGFGIDPLYDAVPPALSAACDRRELPLLRVPGRTQFTAVARVMWQLLADRRHRELRRLSAAQQALSNAATRAHPVPAVLAQLAEQTDGWAVVLDGYGRDLATAGTVPPAPVREDLVGLARRLSASPSSAAGTSRAWRLSAFALTGGGDERLALGVCAPHHDGNDDAVARVAVVLLSLLTSRRGGTGSGGRLPAALVRLLLGACPDEAVSLLRPGAERWTVVHGRRRGPAEDSGPLALAALAADLDTDLLDLDGDLLRALVPGDGPAEAPPGWTLGASSPAPPDALERAGREAARALRRARAEHRPLVRQRPVEGRDVSSLLVPDEARPVARARLRPLHERPELVETLRMWLSVHGSWDRSAVALGVHRNTVRQRVARIGRLLDADLGDADERAELWLALRWL